MNMGLGMLIQHAQLVHQGLCARRLIAGLEYTVPAEHIWLVHGCLTVAGFLDNNCPYAIVMRGEDGRDLFWLPDMGIFHTQPDEFGFLHPTSELYEGENLVISFKRKS